MLKAWKIASCLVLLAVAVSPIVAQAMIGLWPLTVVLAVYFWPSAGLTTYYMVSKRELMVISGGPRFMRPWEQHIAPSELQRRNAPYN
jgi:hypothetical protein